MYLIVIFLKILRKQNVLLPRPILPLVFASFRKPHVLGGDRIRHPSIERKKLGFYAELFAPIPAPKRRKLTQKEEKVLRESL